MSRLVWVVLLLVAGLSSQIGWGQTATPTAEPDPFAMPKQAGPGELLRFLGRLSKRPLVRFKSRAEAMAYHRKASRAKLKAANQLWKVSNNDQQRTASVQAKAEGLSTLSQLGDAQAQQEMEQYLNEMSQHENPAVAGVAKRLRIQGVLQNWNSLDATLKQQAVSDLTALVQSDLNSLDNARLASNFANLLGDTADSPLAAEMLEQLLPEIQQSTDSQVQDLLPKMQGLLRRLQLPGNFLEVEGLTLDGRPIDWQQYRGKVVLVDFWATWCGPCIAELPNVKKNHELFAELGFDVLGVSLDSSAEQAAQFVSGRQIPWTNLVGHEPETSGWEHPLAIKYGIRGIPRAILVDKQGKVLHMNARGEQLGKLLRELLGEPPLATQATPTAAEASVASQP